MIVGAKRERPPWRTRQIRSDIVQWDVATWKHALHFWTGGTPALDSKTGLELGSRDGGLSLFLALKGCRVVCSDHSPPDAGCPRTPLGLRCSRSCFLSFYRRTENPVS